MAKKNSVWEFEPDSVVHRITEVKAFGNRADAEQRSQFRHIEELVFRYELDVLLDERHKTNVTTPLAVTPEQKALRERGYISLEDMRFVKQNVDFVAGQIQKRLASAYNFYVDKEVIGLYLENVDTIFRAKIAQGDNPRAIDHLPSPLKAARKKPTSGQKRPTMRGGKLHKSIAEAVRAVPGEKYDTVQKRSRRQLAKLEGI
jgi:hypothetical protein